MHQRDEYRLYESSRILQNGFFRDGLLQHLKVSFAKNFFYVHALKWFLISRTESKTSSELVSLFLSWDFFSFSFIYNDSCLLKK